MNFQSIAAQFGMTIDQFAEVIGYRRQSLYNGLRKTRKSQEAVERLKDFSERMLEMEVEAAHNRFTKRKVAIREFEQGFRESGYHG